MFAGNITLCHVARELRVERPCSQVNEKRNKFPPAVRYDKSQQQTRQFKIFLAINAVYLGANSMYPTGFKDASGRTGQHVEVPFLIPVLHSNSTEISRRIISSG
jgi:hypothetical protein